MGGRLKVHDPRASGRTTAPRSSDSWSSPCIAVGAVAAHEEHGQADEDGRLRARQPRSRGRRGRPAHGRPTAAARRTRRTPDAAPPPGRPRGRCLPRVPSPSPSGRARPGPRAPAQPGCVPGAARPRRRRDAHHRRGRAARASCPGARPASATPGATPRSSSSAYASAYSVQVRVARRVGAAGQLRQLLLGHRRPDLGAAGRRVQRQDVQRRKRAQSCAAPVAVAPANSAAASSSSASASCAAPLPASIDRELHARPGLAVRHADPPEVLPGVLAAAAGRSRCCAGCRSGPPAGRG